MKDGDICVERLHDGGLKLTAIVDGQMISRRYYWFTIPQAKRAFANI